MSSIGCEDGERNTGVQKYTPVTYNYCSTTMFFILIVYPSQVPNPQKTKQTKNSPLKVSSLFQPCLDKYLLNHKVKILLINFLVTAINLCNIFLQIGVGI